MITENKVTALFCMANDSCKFYWGIIEKYATRCIKRKYCCDSILSKVEVMISSFPMIRIIAVFEKIFAFVSDLFE